MKTLLTHLELIERMDQLVRMQSTGSPYELCARLGISRTKLYRMLAVMKALGAPLLYDVSVQSFVYEEAVDFHIRFRVIGDRITHPPTAHIPMAPPPTPDILHRNVVW